MITIKKIVYIDIIACTLLVCAGFLSLLFFFDFVDELSSIGKGNYHLTQAIAYVALQIPGHIYELLPIALIISAVIVMSRLAQTSQFTILRISGLDPYLALRILIQLGICFTIFTFAIGDYVVPLASGSAQLLKARYQGVNTGGRTGAWLKDQQKDYRYAVNVGAMDGDGNMVGVRIYEFNKSGQLISRVVSDSAQFGDNYWLLQNAEHMEFPKKLAHIIIEGGNHNIPLVKNKFESYKWINSLNSQMVIISLLKPERMSAYGLFRYVQHLEENEQSAQLYAIEFWKKIAYPLSCIIMLMLALPFAYLHFRTNHLAIYVFVGVISGISFFLLNNIFGYIGNISQWQPWIAAMTPNLIYFLLSLSVLGWVVYKK